MVGLMAKIICEIVLIVQRRISIASASIVNLDGYGYLIQMVNFTVIDEVYISLDFTGVNGFDRKPIKCS